MKLCENCYLCDEHCICEPEYEKKDFGDMECDYCLEEDENE